MGSRNIRPPDEALSARPRIPGMTSSGFRTTTIYRQGIVPCIPFAPGVHTPSSNLHRFWMNASSCIFHFSSRRDYGNPGSAARCRTGSRKAAPLLPNPHPASIGFLDSFRAVTTAPFLHSGCRPPLFSVLNRGFLQPGITFHPRLEG